MNYRFLGRTGLRVSVLGIGCQSLGGDIHRRDDRAALRVLEQACGAGVNFFDAADTYGHGNSERLLGRAMSGRRKQVIIATKAGYVRTRLGRAGAAAGEVLRPLRAGLRPVRAWVNRLRRACQYRDFSPRHLDEAVHGSLRRLGTEYLDLFQLHDPPVSVLQAEDVFAALEKLKASGKIRFFGVACARTADAAAWMDRAGISAIQVTVNLLDQEALEGALPVAERRGCGCIARIPLAQGLLTDGTGDAKAEQLATDARAIRRQRERAGAFRFLARPDRTLAQAALRFAMDAPGVSTVIPGISAPAELTEALGSLEAPALTAQELARVRGISSALPAVDGSVRRQGLSFPDGRL